MASTVNVTDGARILRALSRNIMMASNQRGFLWLSRYTSVD
ncbi:hypothetical protein yberc0001_34940 [Yersinia bercovieri ATCC 43970]|uniref:Uncharacterized protein n=1 Tax=Yersinia bercovieri ATCC 43970 TaxID=349968 RepID=A0ABM9Y3H7_YERBE|nr:hypothetical protein yberc0001_34940 [Yersinia bercovieri ATCC 43970]